MAETRLNMKQVLLTAIVTCLFTIVAGVATYFLTTQKATLFYSVSSGPTLSAQGQHRRIFSISVSNPGRKDVSDVSATIEFKQGSIEEVSYEKSTGVSVTETKGTQNYVLKAQSLNPDEHFSIALLAAVPSPEFKPDIAVRGKGVSGTTKDQGKKEEPIILYLLSGAIAAFLGLLTSISPLMRRILGRTAVPSLARAFVRTGSAVGPFDRNELVAYILGLCSLFEHSRRIRFSPSETSFRGAADYIVSEAIAAPEEERPKFCLALKCMLLIKRINEESIHVISGALKKLSGAEDDDVKQLRDSAIDPDSEPLKLRDTIADLIAKN